MLDGLDPHRRFELAEPELAERLAKALTLPVVDLARTLLDLAIENLGGQVSEAAALAVRAAIDRAAAERAASSPTP